MLRQILLSVWWVLEQSTLLSFTDSESVYAVYNAATSAAPLNTSDPLLLEWQEIISLVREAWKDGFSYKYIFAEKKNKSWIQGYHAAQAFVTSGLFVSLSTFC